MRQPNDPLGALHDDHLVRVLSGNVHRRFAELTVGVVAPREHAAGLGHREAVVAAASDLANLVVLQGRDLNRDLGLLPATDAQLAVDVPAEAEDGAVLCK